MSAAIDDYLAAKRIRCAPRTIELEQERLSQVAKYFGDIPLAAITASRIAEYQHARHEAGLANRTINMDTGVLLRVLRFAGRHGSLEGLVQSLPEPRSMFGRALSAAEQRRLFATAASNPEWEHVYCAAVVAANTSLRPEPSSHSVEQAALRALSRMVERADQLGHKSADHYLWPACRWGRLDPNRPLKMWDTAWRSLRDAAGLPGLRFHDLRHTVITELAELGVADHAL